MPEPTNSPMFPAILGVVATLLGAAIGAGATLKSQQIQGQHEMVSQCIVASITREETLRKKAETYVAALSDQISFFQQNHEFEVRKAREKLSEVQKAALVLSVYAGQDLSLKSIAAVMAIEAALVPSSVTEWDSALKQLNEAAAAWHPSFRSELKSIADERIACKNPS